jgi:ABC-2 type transport system ATP-binding protein
MRQRVGLAQALIHRPEVLILDEPTIGLDPAQVVEVRNVIKEIGKDRTVLLSTHILTEAQNICDRVLIINKGTIVAEDTPENLQSRLVGSQRVVLRVRGDSDGLDATIKKVKGTTGIETKDAETVEFEFSSGQDVRPQVAKAVIQAGYELIEMRPVGMSLEEIFLELTQNTPGKK